MTKIVEIIVLPGNTTTEKEQKRNKETIQKLLEIKLTADILSFQKEETTEETETRIKTVELGGINGETGQPMILKFNVILIKRDMNLEDFANIFNQK